nr:MAG TPA: hypothetical protein [Caudoviricetes sp.]
MSYQEYLEEPYEEVERALYIWKLQDERDKLEQKRAEQKQQ